MWTKFGEIATKYTSHEDALLILRRLGGLDGVWFTYRDTRDDYAIYVHDERRDMHSRKCYVLLVRLEGKARHKRVVGRELIERASDFVIEEGIIAPYTGTRVLRQVYAHWRRWPKALMKEIVLNKGSCREESVEMAPWKASERLKFAANPAPWDSDTAWKNHFES